MLRFRHSPLVRTLALLLTLNLTLWSCASAPPTEAEKFAAGELLYKPVPVDSALARWGKEATRRGGELYVRVTFTDSAMVRLDGQEPQFYGGETIELWNLSSQADTLAGVGGPPGPGAKHAYIIPPSEIEILELWKHEPQGGSGTKAAAIIVGVILVGVLIAVIAVSCDPDELGEIC